MASEYQRYLMAHGIVAQPQPGAGPAAQQNQPVPLQNRPVAGPTPTGLGNARWDATGLSPEGYKRAAIDAGLVQMPTGPASSYHDPTAQTLVPPQSALEMGQAIDRIQRGSVMRNALDWLNGMGAHYRINEDAGRGPDPGMRGSDIPFKHYGQYVAAARILQQMTSNQLPQFDGDRLNQFANQRRSGESTIQAEANRASNPQSQLGKQPGARDKLGKRG